MEDPSTPRTVESLVEIYKKVPQPFLDEEEERLQRLYVEVGSRIVAINQAKEKPSEHTLST